MSNLRTEVKGLKERNNNLSKENSAYDIRLNKLTKKLSSISKRITEFDELKLTKMEGKLQELCTMQGTLLPKKRKRKKKPQNCDGNNHWSERTSDSHHYHKNAVSPVIHPHVTSHP